MLVMTILQIKLVPEHNYKEQDGNNMVYKEHGGNNLIMGLAGQKPVEPIGGDQESLQGRDKDPPIHRIAFLNVLALVLLRFLIAFQQTLSFVLVQK